MHNIVIHSSNPRLTDSRVYDVLPKRKSTSLVGKTDFYLVTITDLESILSWPVLRRKPKYVPRKVNRFVDTGVVAKKRDVVETTYTSSYNEYTGKLKIEKSVDTLYSTGLLYD